MEQEIAALQALIGCEAATVWLREGDINFPYIFFGDNTEGLDGLELKYDEGLCGHCIANNVEIISNNASTDSVTASFVDNMTGFQTRSIIALPIVIFDEVYGCVQLLNKKSGDFDDNDIRIAREIVDLIEKNI